MITRLVWCWRQQSWNQRLFFRWKLCITIKRIENEIEEVPTKKEEETDKDV